jgi:hypothetical protein
MWSKGLKPRGRLEVGGKRTDARRKAQGIRCKVGRDGIMEYWNDGEQKGESWKK